MKKNRVKWDFFKIMVPVLAFVVCVVSLTGCESKKTGKSVKLDPKNPITVTVWHYYNGALMNAFETLVKNFNETVGEAEGIIVEGAGMGSLADLEKAVLATTAKEVGSLDMPNIFASYADTAYEVEKMNLLANLGDYLTDEEQSEYIASYIEEGKIGLNGELRIFPIAKSLEIFMLNDTDWKPFAEATGLTYDDLATLEDISRVSQVYYEYTDGLTPDVPNDGKSFFGRDSMANMFIIASKEFGTEIFNVKNGVATIDVNKEVMRKIWDFYYVPYISGYYTSYGRYRSDDAKVGDILSYIGASSSATYFPSEVTSDGNVHSVEAKILPVPHFKDGERVLVQQGAGMVVAKSDQKSEYASVVFLKWFTDISNNIEFASLSGYTPVKKDALEYSLYESKMAEIGKVVDDITSETVRIAYREISSSEMYTNKAFEGGAAARAVLENNLQTKAVLDREGVLSLIQKGESHEQAVSFFNTDEKFNEWVNDLESKLNEVIK